MNLGQRTLVLAAAIAACPAVAASQAWVDAGVGRATLWPPGTAPGSLAVPELWVAATGRVLGPHAIELRVGRLDGSYTDTAGVGPGGAEAPTTWGVEAVPASLSYLFAPRLAGSRVVPFAGAGVVRVRATHAIESDTPRETRTEVEYRWQAALGAAVRVSPRGAIFLRGDYRGPATSRTDIGLGEITIEPPVLSAGLRFGGGARP